MVKVYGLSKVNYYIVNIFTFNNILLLLLVVYDTKIDR